MNIGKILNLYSPASWNSPGPTTVEREKRLAWTKHSRQHIMKNGTTGYMLLIWRQEVPAPAPSIQLHSSANLYKPI